MVLREDDLPEGPVLFADDFNIDSSASWMINRSQSDGAAIFAYDYSADGIAPAPNSAGGSTLGLKLQANDANAAASGISVSPIGQNFTNDYRLRFDAWINYNGPLFDGGSGSTEFASAGIGTKGATTNWFGGGAGVDGIWFSWDGDGGNGLDYRAWRGNTHLTAGSIPAFTRLARKQSEIFTMPKTAATPLQQRKSRLSPEIKLARLAGAILALPGLALPGMT